MATSAEIPHSPETDCGFIQTINTSAAIIQQMWLLWRESQKQSIQTGGDKRGCTDADYPLKSMFFFASSQDHLFI